jgi:hypothetical protein
MMLPMGLATMQFARFRKRKGRASCTPGQAPACSLFGEKLRRTNLALVSVARQVGQKLQRCVFGLLCHQREVSRFRRGL